jgi:hypothetical protein
VFSRAKSVVHYKADVGHFLSNINDGLMIIFHAKQFQILPFSEKLSVKMKFTASTNCPLVVNSRFRDVTLLLCIVILYAGAYFQKKQANRIKF